MLPPADAPRTSTAKGGSTLTPQVDLDPSNRESAAGSIEEISDDLLHVLRIVRGLSDAQSDLHARLESSLEKLERGHAAEFDKLRRDLLGERRAQANRSAFDAIHPAVDQIEMMQATLPDSESEAARYTSVLLSTLRMVLRGLGFDSFSVTVGDRFDPARMECVDYAAGDQGVVLRVLRPGYEADGVVVRRCGVAIADPAADAGGALNGGEIERAT